MTTTPGLTSTDTGTPTEAAAPGAVDRFLAAITEAAIPAADVWADDVTLDATVPNWRFTIRGADAVRATYATWFADAGHFAELRRHPTGGGEVVEYTLCWEEGGVPHMGRHAHILTLDATGRIAEDHVFCGGRWDAALLAEMQAVDDA